MGDRGHADAEFLCKLFHRVGGLGEQSDDFEAPRFAEHLEESYVGVEMIVLLHGSSP